MKLRLLRENEFDFLDTDEPVQDGKDRFKGSCGWCGEPEPDALAMCPKCNREYCGCCSCVDDPTTWLRKSKFTYYDGELEAAGGSSNKAGRVVAITRNGCATCCKENELWAGYNMNLAHTKLAHKLKGFAYWLSGVKPIISDGKITYWARELFGGTKDVTKKIKAHPLYARDKIEDSGATALPIIITNLEYNGTNGCVVYHVPYHSQDKDWMVRW